MCSPSILCCLPCEHLHSFYSCLYVLSRYYTLSSFYHRFRLLQIVQLFLFFSSNYSKFWTQISCWGLDPYEYVLKCKYLTNGGVFMIIESSYSWNNSSPQLLLILVLLLYSNYFCLTPIGLGTLNQWDLWRNFYRKLLVGPEFSSDASGDGPITVSSFNCNGLRDSHLEQVLGEVIQCIRRADIDIMCIQDTRILNDSTGSYLRQRINRAFIHGIQHHGRIVVAGLGMGCKLLYTPAKRGSQRDNAWVGGQLIILSPRVASLLGVFKKDNTQCGLVSLITLTTSPPMTIVSVYNPYPNTSATATSSLYYKVQRALTALKYEGTPTEYVMDKLTSIAAKAEGPLIILGDFNMSWDNEGLLPPLSELTSNLNLRHAADDQPYFSRTGVTQTCIDHILYTDCPDLRTQAFGVEDTAFLHFSDHYPIAASFQARNLSSPQKTVSYPDTASFNAKLHKITYSDLDLNNLVLVDAFQTAMSKAMDSFSLPETSDDANSILERLSYLSIRTLRQLLQPVRHARRLAMRGTSKSSTIIQFHLSAALSIRQALALGGVITAEDIKVASHPSLSNLERNIHRIDPSKELQQWLKDTLPDITYNSTMPPHTYATHLSQLIKQLQRLLHYQKRREVTLAIATSTHKRESRFLAGQLKPVINSLLGKQRVPADHSF